MEQVKNMSGALFQIGKYSFRNIEDKDCDLMLRWRNAENVRLMSFNSDKIPYSDHIIWFKNMMLEDDKKFFIFSVDGEAAGIVGFFKFNKQNNSAYWSAYLGDIKMPKGTGTEMFRVAIKLAQNLLKLQMLYSNVVLKNLGCIRLYKKLSLEYKIENIDKDKPYLTYKIYL